MVELRLRAPPGRGSASPAFLYTGLSGFGEMQCVLWLSWDYAHRQDEVVLLLILVH